MEVAHGGKLFQAAWREGKGILPLPGAVEFGPLHVVVASLLSQPITPASLSLFHSDLQAQRRRPPAMVLPSRLAV